jgi:hypothetical protein
MSHLSLCSFWEIFILESWAVSVILFLSFGISLSSPTARPNLLCRGYSPTRCWRWLNILFRLFQPTAACRSTVQLSAEQVQGVWVHCRWSSTSESYSSEEVWSGDVALWRAHLRVRVDLWKANWFDRVAGSSPKSCSQNCLHSWILPGVPQSHFLSSTSPSLLSFSPHPELWDMILKW